MNNSIEFKSKIELYEQNYYCGDFISCDNIFQNIVTDLISYIENSNVSIINNEVLEKMLNAYEKKDWVVINDILQYEIYNISSI